MAINKLFLAAFLLLSIFLATVVQGIDWGIESSWTTENIKNNPIDAYNANPDKTISTYPQILGENHEIARRWFNEGNIAGHIQLQPSYAKTYFEENGLGGVGGAEYIKHITNGNVELINGRSDIKVADNSLSNVEGPSLDIANYPSGTKIEPNGKDGFKITLPNEGEVSISGARTDIGYGSHGFVINGNQFGAESVSEINIQPNGNYLITTREGRTISVFSQNRFDFNDNVLTLDKGSTVIDLTNGATTHVYGKTAIEFIGKEGYGIEGNFFHELNSKMGKVTFPSAVEGIARSEGLLQEGNIRFCYKCGLDVGSIGDKTVIFNGNKFYSGGVISFSVENDDQINNFAGAIKGVVFETDGRSYINILKNPSTDELRLATIQRIEGERRKLEKQLLSAQNEKTRNIIKNRLEKLPEKLSDDDIARLKEERAYLEPNYLNNYYIKELNDYGGFETLVTSVTTKGNSIYASGIGYNLPNDDYDLKVNRLGFFSDAITNSDYEPIDFAFMTNGKERWSINDGHLYKTGVDEPINYYTDIAFNVHNKNGGYIVDVKGELTPLLRELVEEEGGLLSGLKGSLVKGAFEDKRLSLLTMEMGKSSFSIKSTIDEKLVNEGMWIDYAKRLEKKIADKLKSTDFSFINGKVGMLADRGILPEGVANILDSQISDSLSLLQNKIPDRVKGFEIVFNQISPSQTEVGFRLIDHKNKFIDVPPKIINVNEQNLMELANSNLAAASKQKSWRDVLNSMDYGQLKSFVGR